MIGRGVPGPEAKIERESRLWLESLGGELHKIRNLSRAGWPDRLLLMKRGAGGELIGFCEFKAPGKKPKPHQQLVLDELRSKGVWAFWVDSVEGFKEEVMRRVERD